MTPVKEKIIGAITVMTDKDAESFWKLIEKKYAPSWEDIEEAEIFERAVNNERRYASRLIVIK